MPGRAVCQSEVTGGCVQNTSSPGHLGAASRGVLLASSYAGDLSPWYDIPHKLSRNLALRPVEGLTHIIGIHVTWVESGAVAGVATCLGLLPKSIFFDLLLPSRAWTSVKVTTVRWFAHQGIHTLQTGLSCLSPLYGWVPPRSLN